MALEKKTIKIEVEVNEDVYRTIEAYCKEINTSPGEVLSVLVNAYAQVSINEVRQRIKYFLDTGKTPPVLPMNSRN